MRKNEKAITTYISEDDEKFITEFATSHNISKTEVIRRCIRGSKLLIDIQKAKERIEK